MTKSSKITLLVLVLILLGILVFYYSFKSKSPPLTPDELKEAKLKEMSQSLTLQKDTPQFKAKLEAMSRSLNK